MLQKLKNHALVALLFFALTVGQQYLFYSVKGIPIVWLPLGKYVAVLALIFVLTFSKGPRLRLLLLSFVMIFNYFQMAHLSYYGTQILPVEIYLLFTQTSEIFGTLGSELHHLYVPLLFTLIPVFLGYLFLRSNSKLLGFHFVTVLFCLYFAYNPLRTFFTGNTWGRQPSTRELAGMNVYLSLSYFLGKILPHKLDSKHLVIKDNESLKLKVEKTLTDWENVVVVLGESLSPNHMSLFGYEEPTTVFLNTLKNENNFFFARALSSGVSTDISVAFFLNLGYGAAGPIKAAKGEHCLFKMAKGNGFKTHFLSIQSEEQLRYITPYLCASSLDDFRGMESIDPDISNHQMALDRKLFPEFQKVLAAPGKKFIMLHQRGSHAPWALRYSPEAAKIKSHPDQRVNDYDNSVVEFDLFWKELNQILANLKQKTLVIYLSDHGEAIGEKNKWGHGFLGELAFEIPVLIQAFNHKLPAITKQLPVNFTQYNLGLFILGELGWKTNQSPSTVLQDFVIFGNDIDGLAGKANIKYGTNNNYEFKVIP